MKETLYYKFILGYVLFGLIGFLFIHMAGNNMIQKKLIKAKASEIYDQAYQIANDFSESSAHSLESLSQLLNADIWYLDADNRILYAYSKPETVGDWVEAFDITDFGNRTYMIGSFYNCYEQSMLTTAVPVTGNYRIQGYIVIHFPYHYISATHQKIMNQIYLIALALFGFSLIILLLFTFIVYLPVKKISTAASEYAKGNLTYGGLKEFRGDDEIGRLGVSLNLMASELNTLEEDQKKFIANISHDFRSPLTSIKGYVEAMKDGTIPVEMQDKYLDIVLFETERLTRLTSNLLSLNEWDTKSSRLNLTEVNVYELIKPILLSFEGKCTRKKIQFDFTIESVDDTAVIDKEKIQQVIYNLLDNAIKFSHNNSIIFIDVRSKNDKIFVSVKDTGIGIPRNSIHKIWDRFYKTDLSRGKDKTGSGLGLSIAKEIIQSHGQNINVISTENVGTEFIFTLKKAKV